MDAFQQEILLAKNMAWEAKDTASKNETEISRLREEQKAIEDETPDKM